MLLKRLILPLLVGFALVRPAAALEVGKPAPGLQAKTIDGKAFDSKLLSGNVILINFWASWCAPCRAEMPAIDAYYKAHKKDGLYVIAISMDVPSKDKEVRRIMNAFSFPAAFQREAKFGHFGRIWRMPMTFLIGRDGNLVNDGGKGDAVILDAKTLDEMVTPLLRAAPPSGITTSE